MPLTRISRPVTGAPGVTSMRNRLVSGVGPIDLADHDAGQLVLFNQVTANPVRQVVDQELIEDVLVPGLFQFFDQAGRRHEPGELENGARSTVDAELERHAPRIV